MNEMLARPTSRPAANAAGWPGAIGEQRHGHTEGEWPTTRPTQDVTPCGGPTARAPTSEPTLTTDSSRVNVTSLPPRSRVTKSGKHRLEVERQGADDRHHHERHPQLGDAAGVAQPLPHLALAPRA